MFHWGATGPPRFWQTAVAGRTAAREATIPEPVDSGADRTDLSVGSQLTGVTLTDSDSDLAIGDPAPEFSLPGTDGETHSLADYADYAALLAVFTCNHCPYAKAKFDELNHLAATYDDLAVVGINSNDDTRKPDDSFERMVEYVESGTVAYDAYLRDESHEVARAYGAVCTPDPFLFAREGAVFSLAYHGRIDDAMSPDGDPDRFHMREAVAAVLSGEDVPFADEDLPSRGCDIKWRR